MASVLWPAFLMAGVLEMLVFAFVDPPPAAPVRRRTPGLSPTAVYSVAFFVFWAVPSRRGLVT
jgi:hypothetical protein